jgi:8-oxo-dGTP pyrophosphatase MutT (NUDIX family)
MDERVGTREDPIQKVRGIVFHPDGLLLMRRVRKNLKNPDEKITYYVFPGGGREVGETLEQCLHREVREEAGVRVKIEKEFARCA